MVENKDARPARPKPRLTRSRVAKPLLTSLGAVTLLGGIAFVVFAATTTGSLRPTDWTRASVSVAEVQYQACSQQAQGVDVVGCMFRMGTRPALAAAAPAGKHGPQFSVATIEDPATATTQAGAGHAAPAKSGGTAGRAGAPLVHVSAHPTREEVDAACRSAMKTAQTRSAAAAREVEDECRALETEPPSGRDD